MRSGWLREQLELSFTNSTTEPLSHAQHRFPQKFTTQLKGYYKNGFEEHYTATDTDGTNKLKLKGSESMRAETQKG